MKLKVICQRCGKTDEIRELGTWRLFNGHHFPHFFSKIAEIESKLPSKKIPYDLWICGACCIKVEYKWGFDELVNRLFGDVL